MAKRLHGSAKALFEQVCHLCESGDLDKGAALIEETIESIAGGKYRRKGKRRWETARQFWAPDDHKKASAPVVRGAASALKAAPQEPNAPLELLDDNDILDLVAMLRRFGKFGTAWRLVERVSPENRDARRLRYLIKYSQGDIEAARREALEYVKLIDSPILQLPLTRLLDQCLMQAESDDREPKIARLLWPRLSLPESNRRQWLARLRWGLLTNEYVRTWMLVNRGRLDELDALVELPNWSLLTDAMDDGRPVVLVGSHLGPKSVVLHYLNRLDRPLVLAVGDPIYTLVLGSKLSVSVEQPHSIINLRDSLASVGAVYLAADGTAGSSCYPAKFLGSTVSMREGAAALARLCNAQTFGLTARWAGHRIELHLAPGPTPVKGESRKAWNERWFSFYMLHLESHLLAGPENIRDKSFRFLYPR